MDGILVLDKPTDMTSFDVVSVVRKVSGEKKVGHTGTLDPMATGVLPLLLGRATRCAPFLDDTDKEYEATFRLGFTTDTQDVTGKVTNETSHRVSKVELEAVLPQFRGEILQLPPMYSAVQVDGKRLYSLARKGIEIEREKRPVTIYTLELVNFDEATQTGKLRIICSKGTYIRTLCADIGQALGSFGVLTSLRRTVACGFSLACALTLEQVRTLAKEGTLASQLLPIEAVFAQLAPLTVTEAQAKRFCNGGGLSLERLSLSSEEAIDGKLFRVSAPNQVFLGLGMVQKKTEELRVLRLFTGGDSL